MRSSFELQKVEKLTGNYRVTEISEEDCQTWNAFMPVRKLAPNSIVKIEMRTKEELLIDYQLKDGSRNEQLIDLSQAELYWSKGRLVSEAHPSTTGALIPLGIAFQNFNSFLEPTEYGLKVSSQFTETGLFLLIIPFQDQRNCFIHLRKI